MDNLKGKLLIVGAIPPPIGGVTIHVKRQLEWLGETKLQHRFCRTSGNFIPSLIKGIFWSNIVHLQISKSLLRFLLVLLIRFVFFKKVIFTVHGKLGIHKGLLNHTIDKWSIRLCNIPILLNDTSFKIGHSLNKKARLTSSYIPPSSIEPLPNDEVVRINQFAEGKQLLFCSNASQFCYDSNGKEIYGISHLCKVFKELPNSFKVIISDPTGGNYKYCKEQELLSDNILFLTKPYDFIPVLKQSDGFIRCTTTDGDSISVRESLYYNIPVIASDCIERPLGTLLYKSEDFVDLKSKIQDFKGAKEVTFESNGIQDLTNIYTELLAE